ncbi:MAG TPA: tripartite tricarboxylate transporter substrate-binding protein [Ideonella sp.]|nr:tripartite tricarboxylate transporter substrate-binding protein [Ideonella sp.]
MTLMKTLLAAALCAASLAMPALAQNAAAGYPSKPIRMVVGFAPGGAADVLTRIIATGLGKQLGQQVIVDNKPGADGILSAQAVQTAPPDGYTLLMGTNTAMVSVPALRPNPPYDPFKAFTPISSAGEFSMFLAVTPTLPVKNVNEFLDYVAAHPDKLNSASSNSASELAMLQLLGDRKVVNARYKGDVPAMTDLIGGQIHMIFTTGTTAPTFAKDGRIKILLTLLPQRSPMLPEVPTAAEAGIGRLTITPWAGFFGPAGLPPAITEKLSTELRATLARPDVREQLVQQGFSSYGMTPQEFSAFFRKQYDGFVKTVKDNNIKFD